LSNILSAEELVASIPKFHLEKLVVDRSNLSPCHLSIFFKLVVHRVHTFNLHSKREQLFSSIHVRKVCVIQMRNIFLFLNFLF
ncbi:hypothetical protein M758_5G053500, partial [Ceratodon purpureus]